MLKEIINQLLTSHHQDLSIKILKMEERIMGAIEDLNASVAALSTAVANSTSEITVLLNDVLAANASNNSEAIETAVTAINAQIKALNDATAAASAALTPAATPPAETPAA